MTNKELRNKTVSQADLLRLGWTRGMINKYLPEPLLVPNPMRYSVPMKLYKVSDIEVITSMESFQQEMKKRKSRRTMQDNKCIPSGIIMDSFYDGIEVDVIDNRKLTKEAIMLNKQMYDSNDYFFGTEKVLDQNLMDRYKVNYIRHNLTNYERLRKELKGKRGARVLRRELKIAVLSKIAEAYPELKREVRLQIGALGGNYNEQ